MDDTLGKALFNTDLLEAYIFWRYRIRNSQERVLIRFSGGIGCAA